MTTLVESAASFAARHPRPLAMRAVLAVAAVVVGSAPLALPSLGLGYVTTTVAYAVALLGINLIAGFVGRVALGHGFFVGTGAYTAVILSADHGWPILATVPAAAALGLVLGVVVGVPSLRIRGVHLALVTLSVGASFGPIVKRLESITNGTNGKGSTAQWIAPTWLGQGRDADTRWWYLVTLAIAVGAFVLIRNVTQGRVGRALVALRDNEVAARANGIAVQRYTVVAFGLSAGVASVAGALLMIKEPFASYTNYETALSLQLFAAATFGGLQSIRGAVIGAGTLVLVPYGLRRAGIDLDPNIVFGALLVLTVIVSPGGLASLRVRGTRAPR